MQDSFRIDFYQTCDNSRFLGYELQHIVPKRLDLHIDPVFEKT